MALTMTSTTTKPGDDGPLIPVESKSAFILVTGLFFLWGIPNNLNDVLIRQFMTSFAMSRMQAGFVQSAFYLGYFLLAIPGAFIMRRYGYKSGLLLGLAIYSIGTFLFYPAARAHSYVLFLFALFVIASGSCILETGCNPLVPQMGSPGTAVRRLNFSQAFFPLGSIAGVLIGTIFIFSGIELKPDQIMRLRLSGTYDAYLMHETMRVVMPYMVLGALVLFWGVLIWRTQFPAIATERASTASESAGSYRALLKFPHLMLAVLTQFCYVGAQVGTWSYLIQYVQDYIHLPVKAAGYFLTGTLVAFGIGRFVSTYLMRWLRPDVLMGQFALINCGLVMIGILLPGWLGAWAIFATSFFMSLMFPTIFALGIRDLGANTKTGASLIVMGDIGGAVFTPLIGLMYETTRSMASAMVVPLACYLVVGYFAFWGSRANPRVGSRLAEA
ncbi:MAG TPA: L-fucose:H+ symporter permease [Terracidiphilus sp.]|nr:L-fucose:H+ symporter permease [Terracidiphilus sp.]